MNGRDCAFPGCEKLRRGKDYCTGHLEQRRTGRKLAPLGGAALSPERRFQQRIQQSGDCWEWTALRNRSGYGVFPVGGTRVPAHRYAYEMWVGPIPDTKYVDHVCHNRACVNPEHLRLVTMKQNNENRRGAQRTNPSGRRGVSWSGGQQKWRARVTHNDVTYHLGYFDSLEEAAEAARRRRLELFTHNDADRAAA